MIKRTFDLIFSVIFLTLTFPFILILGILVVIDSKGPMFIFQERIGKDMKPFYLVKLRTMFTDSESKGLLTIGNRDHRVTKVGYFLRKYKLDEFPQFWNVLLGEMSVVGPRPEVKKYVDLYSSKQKEIFQFRPGITDVSSICFWNESDLLAQAPDPEKHYIDVILPQKIEMSMSYSQNAHLGSDLAIILKTVKSFFIK
jgi:lipopolysaccharide/colanic/teichoic acid biosynthesis glycosyltransferase